MAPVCQLNIMVKLTKKLYKGHASQRLLRATDNGFFMRISYMKTIWVNVDSIMVSIGGVWWWRCWHRSNEKCSQSRICTTEKCKWTKGNDGKGHIHSNSMLDMFHSNVGLRAWASCTELMYVYVGRYQTFF